MSSCPPEGVSGGPRILNQRENIVPAVDTEQGRNMGWCLTLTSGHILILAKGIAVGHANVAGGQGRPLRADDAVEKGETAQALTVTDTGASCQIARDSLVWHCASSPSSPPLLSWPVSSRLVFPTVISNHKRVVAEGLLFT